MTETSINYAKALYELSVPEEAVSETEKIFRSTPQLKGALENPLVSLKEKEHVIDRVFPQEMEDFLRREFGAKEVILTLREDKSLIGGFILSAGDKEFDWSLRGRYNNLRQKLTRR